MSTPSAPDGRVLKDIALARIDAFLAELGRIEQSDSPHPHSREALTGLRKRFERERNDIAAIRDAANPGTIKNSCSLSMLELGKYLPILGFLLRATNVRNAFELVSPLQRIARSLLEPKTEPHRRRTRVVLSSEWLYSPYAYHGMDALDGFILVGLPASESSNPLLVPLAGHEFGHPLWKKRALADKLRRTVNTAVESAAKNQISELKKLDPTSSDNPIETLFGSQILAETAQLILRQAEEVYCDFVGVRLFGVSYLRAFGYLLAPTPSRIRSPNYPSASRRAELLVQACKEFGHKPPAGYTDWFDPAESRAAPEMQLRLELSDSVLPRLVEQLLREADLAATDAMVPAPSAEQAERVCKSFERGVPLEGLATCADAVNGAWLAYDRLPFKSWQRAGARDADQLETLKEITLKNIEVFDIAARLADAQG